MIDLKLINGDIVFDANGNLVTVEGDEELAQSVMLTLQTQQGEFFLESEHGLKRDNLLGKVADKAEAKEDIIEAISQEPRIASVEDIKFIDNRSKRTRTIAVRLQKEDGETLVINEVNIDA